MVTIPMTPQPIRLVQMRGAGYSWNYICQVDTNVSTTNQTCTGSKLSCMSGPLSKLTSNLTAQDIKNRLGEVQATNSTLTFTYDAPTNVNDSDISSDANIYLANFYKKVINVTNYYQMEALAIISMTMLHGTLSQKTLQQSLELQVDLMKRTHSIPIIASPTPEIQARIRLLIREWNKPFKGNDSIDLIDPDSNLTNNNMDDIGNLDDSYIGDTWNSFKDFDDSQYYSPAGSSCNSDRLPGYGF